LVKSSVLIFLSRLFGQKDWVRRFLLWLNVANISQMVGVFFAIILQCTPVAFNWDPTITGGYCVDRRVLYISTSVFNIITDILILGLPLWIFSSLRIPKRTKTALLIVFLLGFLYVTPLITPPFPRSKITLLTTYPHHSVTITSIIRLVMLIQGLFNIPIFPNAASHNVGFVTSAIETNLALITASAPALRPIFRSRDRGGWFARSVMATTGGGRINNNTAANDPYYSHSPDVEMGEQQKSLGWNSSRETSPISNNTGISIGASKFGRGGSRGGRKGSVNRSSGRGGGRTGRNRSPLRGSKIKPTIIRIKTDRDGLAELRSSPRSSEEQAMTSNGIVRVSDIQREIDGIVKDIAVAGAGSYTGGSNAVVRPPATMSPRSGSGNSSARREDVAAAARPKTPKTPLPRTPKTPKTPRTPAAMMARPRPSMETITVGATLITPLPPRPSTSGSGVARRAPPERYYSESIYPEQGIMGRGGEDDDVDDDDDVYGDDDRVSRYLDRRFGVLTPKGTTPTSKEWEGSGRPF
jgi:hypothetical protein